MSVGPSHRRNLRGLWGGGSVVLAVYLCVAVAACDESFEPIAPSEFVFSVFGYLDASADTQWIRVMPIRPLKVTSQDPFGATVTIEHLGTGRIVELRDSLFDFSSYSEGEIGSEGPYVHNFWTSEDIEPGATYRFSAVRQGRQPAEAVIEIPLDYAVELAIEQPLRPWNTDELLITGVKHLPFLMQDIYYYDDCGSDLHRIRWEGRSADDETYLITIRKPSVPLRPGCGGLRIEDRHLRIVASEAAWPAGGYSPRALGEAGLTSNVTNAVGFLGGVFTKVIPYEDCEFQSEGAPVPDYCRLRYGPETATMSGTVRDSVYACVGPLDSVTVRLTELDRDPARVRTVVTPRTGEFTIGALEPGIPHLVWARVPPTPIDSEWVAAEFRWRYTEWFDVHAPHTDTLTFTPDQRLRYDINMQRLLPCNAGTLLGTVTEARCGDGPLDSATVELTELDVPPMVPARTVTGYTDSNGEFLITGLRQYVHVVRVRGPDPDSYTEQVDYLGFLPDQVVKYDVQLGRLTSCSEPPPAAR